jgi:hypothetical protein
MPQISELDGGIISSKSIARKNSLAHNDTKLIYATKKFSAWPSQPKYGFSLRLVSLLGHKYHTWMEEYYKKTNNWLTMT